MALPRPFNRLAAVLVLGLVTPALARGDAPADPLLKLVPADAAVTLAVEDLRGHAKAFAGSPLAAGLRQLPAVRDWLKSDRSRGFRSALKKVETVLGEDLATVRDELLGEAVVLTLWLPPGGKPEEAQGLLLVRVPNPPLLDRLIDGLNAAQLKSSELQRLNARERGGTTYHVREFRNPRRPREYYATLKDRVFAWSNSEALIQGAIDRQSSGAGGLAGLPEVRRIRERLPRPAVASLYADPRFVERLMAAASRSQKPGDDPTFSLLARYLSAVRYAGLALEWRDGLILHSESEVDPKALPPFMKRWAATTDDTDASFRRVPPSAFLMATCRLDFGAILDGYTALVSERDRAKLDTIQVALSGLLLGHDVRTEVVPRLGPRVLYYVEYPEGDRTAGPLPWVFSTEIDRRSKTSEAIDNAFRTVLALYALDDKHGGGTLRVESRSVNGSTLTALSASTPFAYAVRDGRVDLGTSADAVSRALAASNDPRASARVDRVRSAYFPNSSNYVAADLRAIHTFADPRRPALAQALAARQHRPESDAARDLDQVLALLDLFDAAFFTTTVSPDFAGVHHRFGLVRVAPRKP